VACAMCSDAYESLGSAIDKLVPSDIFEARKREAEMEREERERKASKRGK